MGMSSDGADKLKASLPPGHVIHTLLSEHEMILGFLDKLEDVTSEIQKMATYKNGAEEFDLLKHIAEHLNDAEAHHKREEDVLFVALEDKGLSGPPQVMRMEHVELRGYKKDLQTLANEPPGNFDQFKKKLNTTANLITTMLRDHIFKENNILYPAALDVIPDEDVWAKLKAECDKIGYCCFTPKV